MEIKQYLKNIDLIQYEDIFVSNGVDFETLVTFEDNDLVSLGITIFGHRKKILNLLPKYAVHTEKKEVQPNHEVILLNHSDMFISTRKIEIDQVRYPLDNIERVSIGLESLSSGGFEGSKAIKLFWYWLIEKRADTIENRILSVKVEFGGGTEIRLLERLNALTYPELTQVLDMFEMDYSFLLEKNKASSRIAAWMFAGMVCAFGLIGFLAPSSDIEKAFYVWLIFLFFAFLVYWMMIFLVQVRERIIPRYRVEIYYENKIQKVFSSTERERVEEVAESITKAIQAYEKR